MLGRHHTTGKTARSSEEEDLQPLLHSSEQESGAHEIFSAEDEDEVGSSTSELSKSAARSLKSSTARREAGTVWTMVFPGANLIILSRI